MSAHLPKKRIRGKLRCLLCQKTFDNDYRISHNRKYHLDYMNMKRHVPYETIDALKSPFEIMAKKQRKIVDDKSMEEKVSYHNTHLIHVIFLINLSLYHVTFIIVCEFDKRNRDTAIPFGVGNLNVNRICDPIFYVKKERVFGR